MARPFRVLRGYLTAAGIDQDYLSEKMGISKSYISGRMNARAPWDADDMYFIMDMLRVPYSMMPELFPKDGKAPLGPLPMVTERRA